MQNIPAVAGDKTNVINAEFIRLTIYNDVSNLADITVHTFSSAYKEETIDGQVFSPLGGLLAVGVQPRDMRVTSADTSVALSGIDGDNIYIVLAEKIKGSKLEIYRGFYNENFVMTTAYKRFTGIITSYNISEDRHDLVDTFTININASSYKTVLQNRMAGRKTNSTSWKEFYPTDTSMDQVASLADSPYDFGSPTPLSSSNPSVASTGAQTYTVLNRG